VRLVVRRLHEPLDVAGNPAAVIVTRRRVGPLVVDIALPGSDEEGDITLDGLVFLGRLVIRPDTVREDVGGGDWAHDRIVRRRAVEFGKGCPRGSR
jgi:hypothetical protein